MIFKKLWKLFKRNETIALDPDNREWEYDGDGTKIYKVEKGYGHKTPVRVNSENMTDVEKMDKGFNGKTYTINGIESDF